MTIASALEDPMPTAPVPPAPNDSSTPKKESPRSTANYRALCDDPLPPDHDYQPPSRGGGYHSS